MTFFASASFAQVSVTATAGTTGPTAYTSVRLAFNAINAGTHQGDITISITGNTTEGTTPATLNSTGIGSASYTSVVLRPTVDGLSISGNPAAGFGVIQLNGADAVTIDGDNPNTGGTNRNLTVTNTSPAATTFGSVIRVATDSSSAYKSNNNITIKNLVLNGNVTGGNLSSLTSTNSSANSSFGIIVGPGAASTPAAITSVTTPVANVVSVDGLLVDNNAINQCGRGIVFLGADASSSSGVTISNNTIGASGTLSGAPPYTSPSTTVYTKGIYVQGTNAISISGNTVQNILSYVGTPMSGIELFSGIGSGTLNISNNVVNGVALNVNSANSASGISVQSAGAPYSIGGNTVTNIQNFCSDSTITNQPSGIYVATGAASATIEGNRIATVYDRNSSTHGVAGIFLNGGNNITFRNNFISDVNQDISSGAAFTTTAGTFGLRIASGTGHKIYHNSIDLSGAYVGTSNSNLLSAAVAITATSLTGLDVRNNILSNTLTGGATSIATVSLYLPSGGTSAMNLTLNNNDYNSGTDSARQGIAQVGTTAGAGFYLASNFNAATTTPAGNLRAYTSTLRSVNGNDNASKVVDPSFVSSTDLHLSSASPLNSMGVSLGVTTDIDGDTRSATNPDIGADEISPNLLANLVPSAGTLTPAFDPGTISYTDSVATVINSITFTPTVLDSSATVTVNGNTVASGSPSGAITLAVGNNTVSVVVTPAFGTGKTYTVVVNRAAPTYTLTYTAGANGTISGISPQTVPQGTSGTPVTALPDIGYHFVNWSDASTANPRTDTNVSANLSVTANFAIDTFTLQYAAGANGSVTGSTSQTVDYGANGTAVTAVANTGYHFVNWSDASTTNPRTDTNVIANLSVTANFAIDTFTLEYAAGANGSVTGTTSQTIDYGANGTAVTAVANTGYHFVNWSDASTANPRTDTSVIANLSVTANFAIDTFTLEYAAGANGSVTGSTSQTVDYGANGTAVTAVANTGYHFVNWSDASTANPRTDTSVIANLNVTANFAIDTVTLEYAAGANGSVTGTTSQTVDYGANGTAVTAVANTGYHFVNWSDASTANPRTDTSVIANLSVTANFAIDTFTLEYAAGANGSVTGTTSQTVDYGANGTAVTAVANTGYHFVNWSDASTANPRTDSNVIANLSVTANFAIDTVTLEYAAGANGSVTGTTSQTVDYGANGTAVTAVANTGYHFVNWSDASTANPRTDSNVIANLSVTANFAIDTFTLEYAAGANGSVTGTTSQTVDYGANGTAVTAVANTGYHFVNWSDASTANPRTDSNVIANLSVTANFAIDTVTLEYAAGANGSVTGTTSQTVDYGANGTAVTAVANTGYHFVNWSDASTANPRTDSNVIANLSVTANFEVDAHVAPIVTNTNDSGPNSLRQAVLDSLSGDTITFNLPAGPNTITLLTAVLLDKDIVISGPANGPLTVSGGGLVRVFNVMLETTVTLSNMTISNGNATESGGIQNSGDLTIENCTLSGNAATIGDGGAIRNDGTLKITNSTLSGNSAVSDGGAILNGLSRSLTLGNVTLAENTAGGKGGGIDSAGTLVVRNSIVALNSATLGQNVYVAAGTATSSGYNLSDDDGGGFLTATGDQINTDPMLGPLKDNGGLSFTHAPLSNSPAIDRGKDLGASGSATGRDQCGAVRLVTYDPSITPPSGGDRSDIGAIELKVGVLPTGAVSRKNHTGAGDFDINLPLSGPVGIECRRGGATSDYQVIVTFAAPVTVTSAGINSGAGSVASSIGNGTNQITLNLTGVTNVQAVTVALFDVNDGANSGDVGVAMGVLIGDTNGDRIVNSGDTIQTRGRSGQTTNSNNFRSDVNADGVINSGDQAAVRSRAGATLP